MCEPVLPDPAWLALQGRRVMVAGAGGIGRAIAAGFVDAGARVGLVDVQATLLKEIAEDLDLEGHGGTTLACDLASGDACRAAVTAMQEGLGGIDVLIHSVGMNDRRAIEEYDDGLWDRFLTVNLSTAFWLAQAAGPLMRAAGSGRVVLLSSVAGKLGHKHHGPYAATKGAIDQLMRVLAAEWAADGVTVNAIAPGYIETSLTRGYLQQDGRRAELTALIPAGRLGVVEDVVGPTLFLASPHAAFITGQVLYIDGGRTLV